MTTRFVPELLHVEESEEMLEESEAESERFREIAVTHMMMNLLLFLS